MSARLSADIFNLKNNPKMTCNETLFDMITAIEAYDFSGVSSTRTMSVHTKHVSESSLDIDISTKNSVPMKPKSCKLSEKENLEIPGESYEVTVSWQIQKVANDIYKVLEELKEYPKHLILRTYGIGGYFIRCEEHGYNFSYVEKDGLLDCELSIHNKNGIQRMV